MSSSRGPSVPWEKAPGGAKRFGRAMDRLKARYVELEYTESGIESVLDTLRILNIGVERRGAGLLDRSLNVKGLINQYEATTDAFWPNTDRTGWTDAAHTALLHLRELNPDR